MAPLNRFYYFPFTNEETGQNKLNKMFKITQLVSFRAKIQTQLSQLWTQVLNTMLNGFCSNAHHALEHVIKEKNKEKKKTKS